MKKYLIKLYTLIVLSISNLSCESAIEIDLPNDQINTSDVFKEYHTTKAALANVYIAIRQKSLLSGDSQGLGNLMGLYTDELTSHSQPNASTGVYEIYNNAIYASNYSVSNTWRRTYENIYAINSFIEGLSKSPYIKEMQKQELLAQAYLARALHYHYLAQLFGDIPYVTSTDYKQNTLANKHNYQQVLTLVETDLLTASSGLTYEHTKERIYPNKSVAELLLAKNYLLQKDYVKAADYATKVIDNPLYKIEDDINKVFKKDAQSTIWQLSPNAQNDITAEARNYLIVKTPPTSQTLSESIMQSFDTNDLRKQNWIKSIGQKDQIWYYPYKYKNVSNNTDEYSIIFRIEEAYFILIEALAYQDKIQQALPYLNKIRQRANLSPLSQNLNKQELINAMLQESRKEFFTEHGHRFLDLKRNNMLSTLQANKANWEQKHSLFPYPDNEILINPNLKPQNYGY